MKPRLDRKRLRTACLALGMCLVGSAHAVEVVHESTDGANSVKVKEETNATGTPVTPTFFGLLTGVPTYGTTGSAYAYESYDSFDRPPEDKVNVTPGAIAGHTVSPKSTTDSASASDSYGNNFSLTDSAYAEARFTGTPAGPGLNAGPISSQLVTSISATMATKTETQQSSVFPAFATATIADPFHFSGLTGAEELGFSSVLDAGMYFMLDTGGTSTTHELRRTFNASLDIGGVVDELYSLVIAVGVTGAGLPDMVVDFVSNALLGLDDGAIMQSILDAFVFNAATNTFTLTSDVTLYDGPIPISNTVTDFSLAFESSATSDWNSFYNHVVGPGSVGGTAVPSPHTLVLLLSGLPLLLSAAARKA